MSGIWEKNRNGISELIPTADHTHTHTHRKKLSFSDRQKIYNNFFGKFVASTDIRALDRRPLDRRPLGGDVALCIGDGELRGPPFVKY